MSRKSKRNRPPQPQPQAEPRPAGTAAAAVAAPLPAPGNVGKYIGIAIAVTTVLVVIALTFKLVVGGGKAEPQADAGRLLALASAQAPTLGPADAKVHIVEFMDPACETCAQLYPHVKKIMADNPGKIRLSVRHVAFHKNADAAVRVLEAARAQGKYFETLEAMLANQERWVDNHRVVPESIPAAVVAAGLDWERLRADMNAAEVSQRMQADLADAKTLAVTKTPEYFVNGRQMPEFGLEQLRNLILGELRRAYP
jgi:protein-disulfide isomerase